MDIGDQSTARPDRPELAVTKLGNVNTTDLVDAIRLGCRTMQSVFNADDEDIPFFRSRIRPETYLSFVSGVTEGHVPGRHLNGLLNAEDAAGIQLDEEAVQKHERAVFFSFSGPVALPLDRDRIGGALCVFDNHNIREGMHSLYALVRFRKSRQAREIAERVIATINEYWNPDHRWDYERLASEHGLRVSKHPFIRSEARAIGPLVKYYRATGYGPAIELALVLKEKAISEFFLDAGDFDPQIFGTHSHSTTCVMSSLAQLADLTSDSTLMNRVRRFYDHGLWKLRDELGWVVEHSAATEEVSDVGEGNNTGDVVETALILGRWGYPQYFHDAERILRGHLLPSQLRDNSFIEDPPNPKGEDGKHQIADRHLGAFGFPAPYGHCAVGHEMLSFNMDIVGGVVGSVCEVLREGVRRDGTGHWVNLLFDLETDSLKVESPYTHGQLEVTVKEAAPLFVRIPPWVDQRKLRLDGVGAAHRFSNDYLFIAEPPVGRAILILFELPNQDLVLKHKVRDIRVRLRGDQVQAMDHFGADLTFFDPY